MSSRIIQMLSRGEIRRYEPTDFYYSDKYTAEGYEFRHVIIPKELAQNLPHDKLLQDREWRSLGITMSRGWQHYHFHKPSPEVLMFKRPVSF